MMRPKRRGRLEVLVMVWLLAALHPLAAIVGQMNAEMIGILVLIDALAFCWAILKLRGALDEPPRRW